MRPRGYTVAMKSAPIGLRILVVDDEKGLRDMLTYALGRKGHRVSAVEGGTQALAAAGAEPFDVALCDVMMPGMGGLETLTALRELRPAMPVILLTGAPVQEEADEALGFGAADYLPKPCELSRLFAAIARAAGPERAASSALAS